VTKTQEQELLKTVADLQKQVADLYKLLENTKIDKHVYTVAETAQILNITPQAVYAMIERGEIESVKLGRIKILGESLRNKLGVIKK
jgi:excisionase family DNA binding protein